MNNSCNKEKILVDAYQVNGVMQVSVKDLRKEFQRNDTKITSVVRRRASTKITNIAGCFGSLSHTPEFGQKFIDGTKTSKIKQSSSVNVIQMKSEKSIQSGNHDNLANKPHVSVAKQTKSTKGFSIGVSNSTKGFNGLDITSKEKNLEDIRISRDDATDERKSWTYGDVKLRKVRPQDPKTQKGSSDGELSILSPSSSKSRPSMLEAASINSRESRDDLSCRFEWNLRQTHGGPSRIPVVSATSAIQVFSETSEKQKIPTHLSKQLSSSTTGSQSSSKSGLKVGTGKSNPRQTATDRRTVVIEKHKNQDFEDFKGGVVATEKPLSCRTPSATDRELKELRSMCCTKKLANQKGSVASLPDPLKSLGTQFPQTLGKEVCQAQQDGGSVVSVPKTGAFNHDKSQQTENNERLQPQPPAVQKLSCLEKSGAACNLSNEIERVRKSLRSVHGQQNTKNQQQLQGFLSVLSPKLDESPIKIACSATTLTSFCSTDHNAQPRSCEPYSRASFDVRACDSEDGHDPSADQQFPLRNESKEPKSNNRYWQTPFSPSNRSLQSTSRCDQLPQVSSMQSEYTTDTDYDYDDEELANAENTYIQISLSSGGIAEKSEPNIVVSPTACSTGGNPSDSGVDGKDGVEGRFSWSHPHHVSISSPTGCSPENHRMATYRNHREPFRGAKNFFFGNGKKSYRKSNLF